MNADVDLIGTVIADYSLGRHRGLTDEETQERAERALSWLVEEVESLQAQLAESQRREQAAVEDIQISHTNMCAICKYEESAPEDGCVVNSNGNCDFVWRGPVED